MLRAKMCIRFTCNPAAWLIAALKLHMRAKAMFAPSYTLQDAAPLSGELKNAIESKWGSKDAFISEFNTKTAAVQVRNCRIDFLSGGIGLIAHTPTVRICGSARLRVGHNDSFEIVVCLRACQCTTANKHKHNVCSICSRL